jgi:hypothetical protein
LVWLDSVGWGGHDRVFSRYRCRAWGSSKGRGRGGAKGRGVRAPWSCRNGPMPHEPAFQAKFEVASC